MNNNKKNLFGAILIVCIIALFVSALTGCSNKEVNTPELVPEKVVEPAGEDIGIMDGVYRISFEEDALNKENGRYCLTFTPYTFDTFTKTEFEPGSYLAINGKSYEVSESKPFNEDESYIMVTTTTPLKNEGVEDDGYRQFGMTFDLSVGAYRLDSGSDYPIYNAMEPVSVPLADSVRINESEEVFGYEDLPGALFGKDTKSFTPINTEVCVQGGEIITITHA